MVMNCSHGRWRMSKGGESGWRVLGRRFPREIFLEGSLIDWSAPMEPWDKVAESRTVPDVAMVMGREGWALASMRRVMLRRKGSDSEGGEERERVGDEVERDKVRSA